MTNTVEADRGTIAGGDTNGVIGDYGTVVGGENNVAGDEDDDEGEITHPTVLGGEDNEASGDASVAAGRNATANLAGTFVVGDSSNDEVESLLSDEARFQGSLRGNYLRTVQGVQHVLSAFDSGREGATTTPIGPTFGTWRTTFEQADEDEDPDVFKIQRADEISGSPIASVSYTDTLLIDEEGRTGVSGALEDTRFTVQGDGGEDEYFVRVRTGSQTVFQVDANGGSVVGGAPGVPTPPSGGLLVNGDAEFEENIMVAGDMDVEGDKNFVETVDTGDGEKEVVYTATEAATPRTEASGVAELEDGRAVVELPDHFEWVTSETDPLIVQTTPYGGTAGLKIVERSTGHIVVESLDGDENYEFAYTVKGTRIGREEKQVIREPTATTERGTVGANGTEHPADD